MKDVESVELSDVTGGKSNTIRALGLATTLSIGEKLPDLELPRPGNPNPIVRIMEPIKPPALPGGATIKSGS